MFGDMSNEPVVRKCVTLRKAEQDSEVDMFLFLLLTENLQQAQKSGLDCAPEVFLAAVGNVITSSSFPF